MKRGRPTKYKPGYCQEIVKFFSKEPYTEKELKHYQDDGETIKWIDYKEVANDIPFFSDFAASIGVNDDTLQNWTKKHPDFFGAYMRAKELQKQFLITNGLKGLYNPRFAIFTATNITDMQDKKEHEISGKNGEPIGIRIIGSND